VTATSPIDAPSPEFIAIKVAELRGFAKEYRDYATKMPTDPFATRWQIIADALQYQADQLESEHLGGVLNFASRSDGQ
jgi:hypothetical protein